MTQPSGIARAVHWRHWPMFAFAVALMGGGCTKEKPPIKKEKATAPPVVAGVIASPLEPKPHQWVEVTCGVGSGGPEKPQIRWASTCVGFPQTTKKVVRFQPTKGGDCSIRCYAKNSAGENYAEVPLLVKGGKPKGLFPLGKQPKVTKKNKAPEIVSGPTCSAQDIDNITEVECHVEATDTNDATRLTYSWSTNLGFIRNGNKKSVKLVAPFTIPRGGSAQALVRVVVEDPDGAFVEGKTKVVMHTKQRQCRLRRQDPVKSVQWPPAAAPASSSSSSPADEAKRKRAAHWEKRRRRNKGRAGSSGANLSASLGALRACRDANGDNTDGCVKAMATCSGRESSQPPGGCLPGACKSAYFCVRDVACVKHALAAIRYSGCYPGVKKGPWPAGLGE